jgi:hypothetical protein
MHTTLLALGFGAASLWPGARAASSTSHDSICASSPHVRHVISVNLAATCVLAKLYEPQAFCLADAEGHELSGSAFDVAPGEPAGFGMIFDGDADFNMEYALTCVAKDGAKAKSPKIIVTIGADGPGTPNVSMVSLYGAEGAWGPVGDEIDLTMQF